MQLLRTALYLLAAGAIFVASATIALADESNGLSISMKFNDTATPHVIEVDDPIPVILTNTTDEPILVWEPSTESGGSHVSVLFTNTRTDKKHVFQLQMPNNEAEDYLESEPHLVELQPQESLSVPILLVADDLREVQSDWVPAPNTGDEFLVSAIVESEGGLSREWKEVWKGQATSSESRSLVVAKWIQTPQDYIEYGFAFRAMALIAEDNSLMERRDKEGQTPLHLAVAFDDIAAVRWLVRQGADINAVTNDGLTPLHLANRVESLKATYEMHPEWIDQTEDESQIPPYAIRRNDVLSFLLHQHPDCNVPDKTDGETATQQVMNNLRDAYHESDKVSWLGILKLYREAGAKLDVDAAIYLDDLELVKATYDKTRLYDGDWFDRDEDTYDTNPLRLAASLGRLKICKYLAALPETDVDEFEHAGGFPILYDALRFPEVVQLLIEHGADLETRITFRGFRSGFWIIGDEATLLHYAADEGDPETVKLLIDSGIDPFATAQDGAMQSGGTLTALHIAAYMGKADNARAILSHPKFQQGDAELRQKILDRCLSVAVQHSIFGIAPDDQRPDLVKALLEDGANPKSKPFGFLPLEFAANGSHWSFSDIFAGEDIGLRIHRNIVSALVIHGADIDISAAVAVGEEEQVARLLKASPFLANSVGPDGHPVLFTAVERGFGDIVAQLIAAGCEVNIYAANSWDGDLQRTALHVAALRKQPEIAQLLIAAHANVNATDEAGNTPLHVAVSQADFSMMRLLLENGADIEAVNDAGQKPRDMLDKYHWRERRQLKTLFEEFESRN